MPDFITLEISYIDRSYLLNLPFLEFTSVLSLKTGVIKEKKIAIFYGMKIILYKNRAFIKGSIHHAYNQMMTGSRPHNCNDFNHENFKAVVCMLQDKISLDPARTKLGTMEFGVNIDILHSASQLLEENFFSHKLTSGPEENKNFAKRGKYKKYTTKQYEVKAYDKARHCHLPNPMLRIEIRTLKAQYTQRLMINTLQDLLDSQCISRLGSDLLKRFNEILILDKYCPEAAAEYWIGLQVTVKPRTFLRRKAEFIKQMEKKDQLTIKKDLLARIKFKLSELIDEDVTFLPLDKG